MNWHDFLAGIYWGAISTAGVIAFLCFMQVRKLRKQIGLDEEKVAQLKFWRDQIRAAHKDIITADRSGDEQALGAAIQRYHLAERRFWDEAQRT